MDGPDNWYIFSNKNITEDLKIFNEANFAVTNLSNSRSVIELEGDLILEVLKKGTPLDVEKLKEGDCANTIYNGITITIDVISNKPKIIRIFGLKALVSHYIIQ